MTTGSEVDYETEYISLRPSENERSTVEIAEEVRVNGYSNLDDYEIDRYVTYMQNKAVTQANFDAMLAESQANRESAERVAMEQARLADAAFRELVALPVLLDVPHENRNITQEVEDGQEQEG